MTCDVWLASQRLPDARIVSVGFNADLTFWLNGFALGIEEQVHWQ